MQVSICLPVFEGQSHLAEAIESVLKQTFSDFELLIADDSESDGCWTIIEDYVKQDKRIKAWRNEKRLGLFGNYNETMHRAEGHLIKPFAQDDILLPSALEKLVAALNKNQTAVLAACDRESLSQVAVPAKLLARKPKSEVHESLPAGFIAGKKVIAQCLSSYRNLIGEPVAVLFRSDLVKSKNLRFNPVYLSLGDLDFWLRILHHGDFVYVPEKLVQFRCHENAQTQKLLHDIDWVLDILQLSRVQEKAIKEAGMERQDYCTRFLELAAPIVEATVSNDKAYIDALPPYKEIAYYLLKRMPQALDGESNYQSVLNSTSWKVTRPLRAFGEIVKK